MARITDGFKTTVDCRKFWDRVKIALKCTFLIELTQGIKFYDERGALILKGWYAYNSDTIYVTWSKYD